MPQRQGRLYYGWVIVGVMSAAMALSMALGTLNFGLFIRPMGDHLGIGRASFGWAQTARATASALTSPLVGRLIDRFGSRVLLAVAAALSGVALVGVANITEPWQMVAIFAITGLVDLVGPGSLVTTVPVAKWFVRRRGRAMGLTALGTIVGGVIFLPLTQFFIDTLGWRRAWLALAAIGAGPIVFISLLLVRRAPEDLGLAPDGDAPADTGAGSLALQEEEPRVPSGAREVSWTLQEAVRSFVFWRLVFVFSIIMLAVSSAGLHRLPNFVDQGLAPQLVAFATAVETVAVGVSTFFIGFLVERFQVRFLGGTTLIVLSGAMYFTIIGDTPLLLFLAMITFGIGIGGMVFLQNFLWADYFGREHLGSIRGAVTPVTLIFAGIGAPLAGYVRDGTGSYNLSGQWASACWWPPPLF